MYNLFFTSGQGIHIKILLFTNLRIIRMYDCRFRPSPGHRGPAVAVRRYGCLGHT